MLLCIYQPKKDNIMRLVDVAVFVFPGDSGVLESILEEENISYFLNNQNGAIIIPGSGSRLSIDEKDEERVIGIIREAGFERFLIKN
jgi:hypothetical protein